MRPRLVIPPPLLSSPRSSLDKISHTSIDSVLKSLKACSRRLQNVLSVHKAELQVLNRLYYKGKNQHRSALFWKRAGEIRRYASRLDAMGMLNVVESLHRSFFDEAAQQNPKLLKGPWTRTPCASYVCYIVERLSSCYALVEKMHERLVEAHRQVSKHYSSFTLAMQSGAFIQLILTLAAIASRMYILMSEIQDILVLTWTAGHRSLQVLSPSCAMKLEPIRPRTDAVGCEVPVILQSTPNTYEFDDGTYEDLGNSMAHLTNDQVSSFTQEVDVNETGPRLSSSGPGDTIVVKNVKNVKNVGHCSYPSLSRSISRRDSNQLALRTKQHRTQKSTRPDDIVPAQKKRDEIDDIFGF